MTSAASPAVSGEDSLVPPNNWNGDGLRLKSVHSVNISTFEEHRAQPESPGATTSTVRASCWAKPPELNAEMLLLMNPPWAVSGMAPLCVCAYDRQMLVPPTAMTPASVPGVPRVPAVPASPVLTTTVTPALMAA